MDKKGVDMKSSLKEYVLGLKLDDKISNLFVKEIDSLSVEDLQKTTEEIWLKVNEDHGKKVYNKMVELTKTLPKEEVNTKEYFMEKLKPILSDALTNLVKEKPEKPIKWLANYLLENNPNKANFY